MIRRRRETGTKGERRRRERSTRRLTRQEDAIDSTNGYRDNHTINNSNTINDNNNNSNVMTKLKSRRIQDRKEKTVLSIILPCMPTQNDHKTHKNRVKVQQNVSKTKDKVNAT